MSHYILQLTDGRKADVREGTIRRKVVKLWPFRGKSAGAAGKKRAYIVHIGAQVCLMLRTMDGAWLEEPEGNFVPSPDDALSRELKRLIENHA